MTQLVLQLDNLSSDASEVPVEETLTQILTQQGILFLGLHVKGNSAYVDFENNEYAQRAFTALDGLEFMGSRITVSYGRQENGSTKYKEGFNRERNYKGRRNRRPYQNEPMQSTPPIEQYPCRILIPTAMIKVVLGKDGGTIQGIEQATNTKIDVHREKNVKGSEFTVTTIKGSPRGFSEACEKIVTVIEKERKANNESEPSQLKILGHDSLCGRVIGKEGRNLKSIKQRTGARVIISNTMFEEYRHSPFGQEPLFSNERVITIEGTVDVIAAAEEEISKKLRKSLEQDMKKLMQNSMYPPAGGVLNFLQGVPSSFMPRGGYGMPGGVPMNPFSQYSGPGMAMNGLPGILGAYPQSYSQFNTYVPYHSQHVVEHCTVIIPTQAVGAVIGKKGLFINRVKEFSQAQQVRVIKGEEGGDSRVEIIGIPEAQWKVQLCVFSKLQEAFRPGMSRPGKSSYGSDGKLRTEYMVPGSSLGRIIGKKGQVVLDIQDSSDTDIEVPKDKQGGPQAPVYITGTFNGTQMALNRIRDIVARSQHQESMK